MIRDEFIKATGIHKRTRDSEEYFRRRLVYALHSKGYENHDLVNNLSKEAFIWFLGATQEINDHGSKGRLPPFPEDKERDTRKRILASKSATSRYVNLNKRKRGGGDRVRELMLERGVGITPKEISKIMESEGYSYSIHTIHMVRSEFRRALQTLWEAEMLKNKPTGIK